MVVQPQMTASSSREGFVWKEPAKSTKPPKDANLQTAWAYLQVGVEHMMTRSKMGMSYAYYMTLYTVIYDYCTQSKPGSQAQFNFPGPRSGGSGANLQGADLYRALGSYFSDHCRALRERSDNLSEPAELLALYSAEWENYTTGAAFVNKLFNYLNKHWVKREKDEGRKEVYTVYTLALVQWKNIFFKSFQKDGVSGLTSAVLRQIERQRNREPVDTSLLKGIVESYVLLGLDESDAQRQNLDVYNEFFQIPFIAATEQYYRNESERFVVQNSVPDYMKKAEARLEEEDNRVKLYLANSTSKVLKETMEKTLIDAHKVTLTLEFQTLLDNDRDEDLKRMYTLLSKVPKGLEPLRTAFETHVEKAGQEAVKRVLPAPGAVTEAGKAEVLEPKAYIEALLDVHSKYRKELDGCFKSELGFNASLDKACRKFINQNDAATTSTKSPELLASYCDQLLKKSNKDLDAEGLERQLSQAMIVFDYIDDKDVFQKFYQKKLAQRLVGGLSASDDSESSMISKLKEKCGFDYTNKLQKMFTDVAIGRELTERFKDKERSAGRDDSVDGTFMVLGTNFWPLGPQQTDFAVPHEIQKTYDSFTKFYSEQHSGRKLTWLWHVSKNEIRTTYLSQKYIFMVSSYQMAILTQFNNGDSLSLKDLLDGTRIAEGYLKPQLATLVKAKVLLQEGDTYDLNLNFKSKKIRVNLNIPVRAEQKADQAEVLTAVDEDRKFIYQATIVRIMKARKSCEHQRLVQEVVLAISTKFTPKVPEIKKAIDFLIDKDYLERSTEDRAKYNYVA